MSPGVQRLVAITGATGFLGQHLVRAFADAGWRVRILARRDPVSPFWVGLDPEVICGDLADEEALRRLCEGAEVVVHAGGRIGGAEPELRRVNIEGARRVARAARAAQVGHLLQISSITAREPQLSPYAASKRGGEDAVRAILGGAVTVVRPPVIYGPGDRETLRLFRLAALSPVLPVLNPAARIAIVHVQDAARQIVTLARSQISGVVTLSDGHPEGYSWSELMQAAAEAAKRRVQLIRVPTAALYVIAFLEGFKSSWRDTGAVLTFGKVKELTHWDWGLDSDERAGGAQASEFDLRSGFQQTIGWYRSKGWL